MLELKKFDPSKASGSKTAKYQGTKDYEPLAKTPVTDQRLKTAKVKDTDLIMFTTQLAVMLDSGVVLSDALDSITEAKDTTQYDVFKLIIMDITEMVKNGESFSTALAAYPKIFSSMFISMVKASEASGKMVEMLNVLSGYLDFEYETKKRIKGALTYPFIMAAMAIVATTTLIVFVLPRFTKIYETRGAALPQLTQVLVNISKIMSDTEIMTLTVTTVGLLLMAAFYWSSKPSGRKAIDFIKVRTPLVGTMVVDALIARSTRIMSTMVNTGVNLLDTIEVIKGASNNYYFQHLWTQTDSKIRDGHPLSESIHIATNSEKSVRLIAPEIIQMLRAGEKSGNLGEVSDKISVFYEKKLEASIRTVMSLIEPLMIIVLGGIIGIIAIGLLLPVFKISTLIAH